MQNFRTLGQPLLGEKKRKEKNEKNRGHYVPLQRPRAAHALCSDQKVTSVYGSSWLSPGRGLGILEGPLSKCNGANQPSLILLYTGTSSNSTAQGLEHTS